MRDFIKFPHTQYEWNKVKQQFYDVAGMPGVDACIVCTHIKIQNSGGLN